MFNRPKIIAMGGGAGAGGGGGGSGVGGLGSLCGEIHNDCRKSSQHSYCGRKLLHLREHKCKACGEGF